MFSSVILYILYFAFVDFAISMLPFANFFLRALASFFGLPRLCIRRASLGMPESF
jgi:hypothetical protein